MDNLESIKAISLSSSGNGGGNSAELQKQLLAMQSSEQNVR